jgi:hypothetical protein
MTKLFDLKIIAAKRPTQLSPAVQRRNKISKRIAEQIELATAAQDGKTYAPTKQRKVTDAETGDSKLIQVPKRIKPWWFVADNGKLCVQLRFGAKVVEFTKGKGAIEVASPTELVTTLTVLRDAVMSGELDAQIETVSGAVKAGFKK